MNFRTRRNLQRAAGTFVLVSACILAETHAMAAGPAPAYRAPGARVPASASNAPASRSLNRYQIQRLSALASHRIAASSDTLRLLALQVQFSDSLMGGQPGSNRPQLRDSTWFANELEHMGQYFRGASRQRFQVRWTVDGTLYSLPKRMNYYGSDTFEEERVVELAQTVIDDSDAKNDFSGYDHVFIIHAGAGQETDIAGDSPIQIWSSFYDLGDIRAAQEDPSSGGLATVDSLSGEPFFVDNFSVVPSHASQDFATIGNLGIWAFQIGTRIGLVPLFDSTPAGAQDSQGAGSFDLMAYGLFNVNGFIPGYPCAFNRMIAGWVDPVVVDAAPGAGTRLTDINTGSDADTVCVKVPITENEYYLVVNRVHDANFDSLFTFNDADSNLIPNNTDSLEGAEFDFFLTDLSNPFTRRYDPNYGFNVLLRHTGDGIYVWHVDEQVVADAVLRGYLPDDFVARKGVDLEEADGVQDLDRPGDPTFALGSHFDSYRTGEGNASVFGPATVPASRSNSGTATGIAIATTSPRGFRMDLSVSRDIPYDEQRTRWAATSPAQPATAVNLDGAGDAEIVVLSDDAGVYVFDAEGREWDDPDANPATVAPYITVPGVRWTGPPAFADLDGGADIEIVAIAAAGDVYAWKASGAELTDGDSNPATTGVLFHGEPMAAPPVLLDIDGDTVPEIAIVEHDGSALRVRFVDAGGAIVAPASPLLSSLWPVSLPAQRMAPPAVARLSDSGTETWGLVAACVDTTSGRVFATWTPAAFAGATPADAPGAWTAGLAPAGSNAARVAPSAPAAGDLDADGDDEVVVALADGTIHVLDVETAFDPTVARASGALRAAHPSAPALGDVDRDGTLEIAVWDSEYMYLLKSNARTMVEWPAPLRPVSAGEAPAIAPKRELESPLVADVDGDGAIDVLFPLDDGTLMAVRADGTALAGFPRVAPSEMGTAPMLAELSPGAWGLVSVGSNDGVRGVDAVVDSLQTQSESTLSVQSLAWSPGTTFWPAARVDLARSGRVAAGLPLVTSTSAFDGGSFMIYPNPATGAEVRARIALNSAARVELSVYTIEGQEALSRTYDVNPNGLVNTPFDEAVDIHGLKSGIYLLRLRIDGGKGGGSVVKPFAVRR